MAMAGRDLEGARNDDVLDLRPGLGQPAARTRQQQIVDVLVEARLDDQHPCARQARRSSALAPASAISGLPAG